MPVSSSMESFLSINFFVTSAILLTWQGETRGDTTGIGLFVVCQGHTTKAKIPTAKALPCAAHGKRQTTNSSRQTAFVGHLLCVRLAHSK